MTWTPGTWADVALGDTVLGGDSYPWTVVDGAVNHFDMDGWAASVRVTIERDGAGRRTADIMITKPVKYQPFDQGDPYIRRFLKCVDCLSDANHCRQHGSPEEGNVPILRDTAPALNDVSPCAEVNRKMTAKKSSSVHLSGTDADSGTAPCSPGSDPGPLRPVGSAEPRSLETAAHPTYAADTIESCATAQVKTAPDVQSSDDGTSGMEVPRETEIACRPNAAGRTCEPAGQVPPEGLAAIEAFERFLAEREPAPPGAPHIEYDDTERAAASALKAAGITAQVIERVMTLEGLASHLLDTHGVELPSRDTKHGRLLGVEYRAVLADMHFDKHAEGQEAGEKWRPRGRTPHTHPVMDRPMENPIPRSWAGQK